VSSRKSVDRIHVEQDRLAAAAVQAHKQVAVTSAAYQKATEERREAVTNLRDAGWSLQRIATLLGVSKNAVVKMTGR
jgi:DNA-directed RNA polymerase specialized sigma24 family protein